MGLLAVCIVIGAVIAICFVISKIYNWVIYDISPIGRLRKTVDWFVEWWNKWVIPVLVGAFCIFVVCLLAFGAWSLGLDLLKRFACR